MLPATIQPGHRLGIERRATTTTTTTGGRRWIQDGVGHHLHAAHWVPIHGRFNRRQRIRDIPSIHRQHRLNGDVDVRIVSQAFVVGAERSVAGLVERLAGANRLNPHARLTVLHQLAGQHRVECTESLERPQRVKPREEIRRRPRHRAECRHDGELVLLEDQQLLRHLAPPPVRVPRMNDETPAQLVVHLAHPNGWWRDTAQQLLVLKQDKSVVPALRTMARTSSNLLARFHALWTLEGLGALDAALSRQLMEDRQPRMRIQAIRASETLYKAGDRSLGADYERLTEIRTSTSPFKRC